MSTQSDLINNYVQQIAQRYALGNTTEHSFRGDLQQLIEGIVPDIKATNEPKRQACGAPDYIITMNEIPVGFIEAKDLGDNDLAGKKHNKEQFNKYRQALGNLIFTDYLRFHLYREGEPVLQVAIAELTKSKDIRPLEQNFPAFIDLINDFCIHVGQTITNPQQLAEMMAGKARLLAEVLSSALTNDQINEEDSTLKEQLQGFKEYLLHDISPKTFADVYAQTIVYGLFAARLRDTRLETFTRQKAAELIPKANPFLRGLFSYIAGTDIDKRIVWIVDSLIDVFLHADVKELLKDYGRQTQTEDPIIHFYETFLQEYDPRVKKQRGVYYTPKPAVGFIVRAVDDILKSHFALTQGLADSSTATIKVQEIKGEKPQKREVHKVQLLDPGTGTGTFLAEIIRHIHKSFHGQQGIWSSYVEKHLLPRLNGFEILMAPYAMAHLKLDLVLQESGYVTGNRRFNVFLTNSLEEHHPDTNTLFATWLAREANEANRIKRDVPIMCVVGNPPYSVSTANKGEWIKDLIAEYKEGLNEKNIQPLSDDYIKFIRYGQYNIERNKSGILAYIVNNSFLDGNIHRQMRKRLLETFDEIYVLDLHGNAKKRETSPDGSKDENVFDIQQGVSINLFVKTGKKRKDALGNVYHAELYGRREQKYQYLNKTAFAKVKWKKTAYKEPYYFFVPKDWKGQRQYQKGFRLDELFPIHVSGIATHNDNASIFIQRTDCQRMKEDFLHLTAKEIMTKHGYKNVRDWKVEWAKGDLQNNNPLDTKIMYRPFDSRFTYYTGKTKGIMGYPRANVMRQMLKPNLALQVTSKNRQLSLGYVYIANTISDRHLLDSAGDSMSAFPLYLYPQDDKQTTIEDLQDDKEAAQEKSSSSSSLQRVPNLNKAIVEQISNTLGLPFVSETSEQEAQTKRTKQAKNFAPLDLLDYIYAILHSPSYRNEYQEFLKMDFPRVPYPKDKKTFWQLVALGKQLRYLHLLEQVAIKDTRYPIDGSNEVEAVKFVAETKNIQKNTQARNKGRVYVNREQYFENVPLVAWEFYIGGYQPAQKWLKDRKGRNLQFEDIQHYQKIISALTQTEELMNQIEKIEFL